MHYYIDGYNFLFLICKKSAPLESRRNSLIEILNNELKFLKGHASVIFDSAEQVRDSPQCAFWSFLEVIYAPEGLSADEYIIELVEHASSPKTLMVVTSDNDLAGQCKRLGAHTKSIENFIDYIVKKNTKKTIGKPNYFESSQEIERLRKIFEDRLKD